MKFGRSFHRYTVPQWASTYIDYAQLKQDYKRAALESPLSSLDADLTKFYITLNTCLEILHGFHRRQTEYCQREYQCICNRFALDSSSISPVIPPAKSDESLELFRKAVSKLQHHLTILEQHLNLNELALSRIYRKVLETVPEPEQELLGYQGTELHLECGSQYPQLRHKLAILTAAVSDSVYSASDLENKDLLSSQLRFDTLPYYEDLLRIVNDNPTRLFKILRDQVTNPVQPYGNSQEVFDSLVETAFVDGAKNGMSVLQPVACSCSVSPVTTEVLLKLIKIYGWLIVDSGPESDRQTSNLFRQIMLEDCLKTLLESAPSPRIQDLQLWDETGQSVLHYIAIHNLLSLFEQLVKYSMNDQTTSYSLGTWILSSNSQQETPLHLAVISNRLELTKQFIRVLKSHTPVTPEHTRKDVLTEIMIIAIMYGYDKIVRYLASEQVGIGATNSRGETALYVAAKFARNDYVNLLLETSQGRQLIEHAEHAHGWTPLFITAVNGDTLIAQSLLRAGADSMRQDSRGWSVLEHAAYRGHIELALLVQSLQTTPPSIGTQGLRGQVRGKFSGSPASDLSYVVINLGTIQKDKFFDPVYLLGTEDDLEQGLEIYSQYSLELSLRGSRRKQRFRLPLIGDLVNELFVPQCDLSKRPQLVLKLYRNGCADAARETLVGSGTIPIGQGHRLDQKREGLIREFTVSILGTKTLECIALITLTMVISTPYTKLQTPLEGGYEFGDGGTHIIGHRGAGQNLKSSYLQLGENTMQSFLSAADQGASWVEFDLQMTRDLVPVLYHDFSLSESGTDVPIHDVSLKQFLHASMAQSLPDGSFLPSNSIPKAKRDRSSSQVISDRPDIRDLQDRMQYTFDFADKGFKSNTRGRFIQEPFATLEDVLIRLPEKVKLDIEVKYPRIHETLDADVSPVGIDINMFVDKTLDVLHKFAGKRQIILSSFSPETCILMKLKQKCYPVMYITNAGKPPDKDKEIRTASVQAAVHFSRYWGLDAVCFESVALISTSRLIGFVKSMGLGCASYGPLNNVPEHAKLQADAGLDMIVADRIGTISRVLDAQS